MIWIKIFAGVGILACAVILVAIGCVIVSAISDKRRKRFMLLEDRLENTKEEINMWLTENQKRLDDLEERISLCKASVEKIDSMTDGRLTKLEVDLEKHIGYLDTVYDVLKWNLKDLDFARIRTIETSLNNMAHDIATVYVKVDDLNERIQQRND